MNGDDVAELFMHTVTVETYQGTGAYGETWSPESSPVPCLLDQTRRLVRDDKGDEVVSEGTVYAPLQDASLFAPASRVHADGRIARVISCKRADGDALGLPSHIEVTLT